MAKADDLIDELVSLFPERPPSYAKPFGKLLEELRASGRIVNSTSLRRELTALVASGKWKMGRAGNITYYWPVKTE